MLQHIDPKMYYGLLTREVYFLFPKQYWMGEQVGMGRSFHVLGTQVGMASSHLCIIGSMGKGLQGVACGGVKDQPWNCPTRSC